MDMYKYNVDGEWHQNQCHVLSVVYTRHECRAHVMRVLNACAVPTQWGHAAHLEGSQVTHEGPPVSHNSTSVSHMAFKCVTQVRKLVTQKQKCVTHEPVGRTTGIRPSQKRLNRAFGAPRSVPRAHVANGICADTQSVSHNPPRCVTHTREVCHTYVEFGHTSHQGVSHVRASCVTHTWNLVTQATKVCHT